MSFINKSQLGIYAPKASEKAAIGAEAQTVIKDALSTYKKLYYGLRQTAWQNRDKRASFMDAKSKGELEQFIIAPGCRQEDGSYSKDEWDYEQLNKYLWERFCTHFEDTFGLERIQELTKLKDLLAVTEELLGVALDEWGHRILERIEDESWESLDSVPLYTIDLPNGIRIEADFRNPNKRTIAISAPQFSNIPDVLVEQRRTDICWQGRIYSHTTGATALTSNSAELLGEMLELSRQGEQRHQGIYSSTRFLPRFGISASPQAQSPAGEGKAPRNQREQAHPTPSGSTRKAGNPPHQ